VRIVRHWAVDVESGNGESGMEHNSTCSLFSVIITLTDEGLDHLYPVRLIIIFYSRCFCSYCNVALPVIIIIIIKNVLI